MNKKYVFILIGAIISLLIGGTYAFWKWSSTSNAIVSGRGCVPDISFTGGTTINGTNLEPVSSKEQGLNKDINVNLYNNCDNDTAVLNLKLKLDKFPNGLADSSFKWSLYKVTTSIVNNEEVENETLVSSGNFSNEVQNNVIDIANNLVVNQNISTYRLYIWIDGTMDNPYSIGGNSFILSLYGEGTNAIYEQNVMGDYHFGSANDIPSYFLVNSLSRDSVESIEITKISTIPNGVTSYDVSANSDGSVKLWYVLNPETNLNKVYIGSESGIVKANVNMARFFGKLTNVVTIDLSNLDTSGVTDIRNAFYNCTNLINLNLNNFNTTNVTNMQYMFYGCKSITSLDLSSFNTINLTNTQYMFYNCNSLTSLDLSNFNTEKVTNMQYMFYNCNSLTSLDLSNFNTEKVTNMQYMFYYCNGLISLDLSNFNTEKVTNMHTMFYYCNSLTSLDLSSFNTSNVTDMFAMFYYCNSLTSLDLSNFNTAKVTNMQAMFSNCSSLINLDLSSFNTANVTNMRSMFSNCSSLINLDLSSFNTANVTTMFGMFNNCSSLTTLNLGNNFDTSNVTNMYAMFATSGISDLTILSNFNTGNVTNMARMFYKCTNIKSLNGLQNFDVSKVDYFAIPMDFEDDSYATDLRDKGIFQGLTNLEDASAINNWNIKASAYFYHMFYNSNDVHPTFSRVNGTWSSGTFTPSV